VRHAVARYKSSFRVTFRWHITASIAFGHDNTLAMTLEFSAPHLESQARSLSHLAKMVSDNQRFRHSKVRTVLKRGEHLRPAGERCGIERADQQRPNPVQFTISRCAGR